MDDQHKGLLGLFGNPVEHSLSPLMQNTAINDLGLPYIYLAFKVEPQNLVAAVEAIRALNMRGVNVTIPFKEAVIPLLDELSPAARACGAVNLIKNENGHLTGFNTDGQGFIRSLTEAGIHPRGRIVFIGAGGAARAVAYEMSRLDVVEQMVFLDTDETKAVDLAALVLSTGDCQANGRSMNEASFEKVAATADFIINCTSVGMFPNIDRCPVASLDTCRDETVICDLVYNPLQTRFLLMAQERGLKNISGLSMLVHQGALALEILTACQAPVAQMKEVVLNYYQKPSGLHTN